MSINEIEKLLLIVLFIVTLYYPLCGVIGFIEFIQSKKKER